MASQSCPICLDHHWVHQRSNQCNFIRELWARVVTTVILETDSHHHPYIRRVAPPLLMEYKSQMDSTDPKDLIIYPTYNWLWLCEDRSQLWKWCKINQTWHDISVELIQYRHKYSMTSYSIQTASEEIMSWSQFIILFNGKYPIWQPNLKI